MGTAVGIFVAIILIYLAIQYWPITVTIVAVIIIVLISRKVSKSMKQGELKDMEDSLASSQGEISRLQSMRQKTGAELAEVRRSESRLKTEADDTRRYVTFFSAVAGRQMTLGGAMEKLENQIRELTEKGDGLEKSDREMERKIRDLESQCQILNERIPALRQEIK